MPSLGDRMARLRSLSYAEYRQTYRFPALDGLRAVTVLSLIGLHYGNADVAALMGEGKITVFFVLSGFLITLLLLRDEERHDRIRLRHFYVRRQFRLLPIYYTVLGLSVLVAYGSEQRWNEMAESLPYYLTFTQEFHPEQATITTFVHSWTMAYEQKFYLTWPLIFLALSRYAPRLRTPIVLGLTAAVAATIPLLAWMSHYFALLLGCALALVCHAERGYRILQPLTHPLAGPIVLGGFLVLHAQIPGWTDVNAPPGHWAFAVYAVGAAALVMSILNSGLAQWLLTRKFLLFVGERGYGIYLMHGLAGAAVVGMAPEIRSQLNSWLVVVAACAMSIAFADVLQRWVELPIAARGRQFNAWLDRRAAERAERQRTTPEPSQIPSPAVAEPDSQPVRT